MKDSRLSILCVCTVACALMFSLAIFANKKPLQGEYRNGKFYFYTDEQFLKMYRYDRPVYERGSLRDAGPSEFFSDP